MVKSLEHLKRLLAEGKTVSLMCGMDDDKWRWVVTETCETIRSDCFRRALKQELVVPFALDIAGEPMQYHAAP